MRSRMSPIKRDGPGKRVLGRFGRKQAPSPMPGGDGAQQHDGGGQSTDGSAPVHSHGPVQPQESYHTGEAARISASEALGDYSAHRSQPTPLPDVASNTTTNWQEQTNVSEVAECELKPSTSSSKAVMAIGCSTSTDRSDANKAVSPASIASKHPIVSPTQSTSPVRRPRANSNALETPKDKDDAYSAWWFLASISESFDTLQSSRTPNPDQKINASKGAREANQTAEVRTPVHQDGIEVNTQSMHYPGKEAIENIELPSLKPTREGSPSPNFPQVEQPSQQQTPKQTGGKYTLKEQRKRREWLANHTLGGTLDYDKHDVSHDYSNDSTATPYHYIPPKQSSLLPINRPSSDWDANVMRRIRSNTSDLVEWTPQDSSYGAAVPAFGWIPKRVRKMLEGFFLVIIFGLLIYVVVKVGIKLKSSGSGGGEDIYFDDDDHYLADRGSRDSHDGDSNDSSNDGPDRIRRYI